MTSPALPDSYRLSYRPHLLHPPPSTPTPTSAPISTYTSTPTLTSAPGSAPLRASYYQLECHQQYFATTLAFAAMKASPVREPVTMASHAVAQNPNPASLLESARPRPLQTELDHIYGSSAAAVGATPVICRAPKNYDRITEDIADLRPEAQHVRVIASGSAYVTVKSLRGETDDEWLVEGH